jgi:hypothetical protein
MLELSKSCPPAGLKNIPLFPFGALFSSELGISPSDFEPARLVFDWKVLL